MVPGQDFCAFSIFFYDMSCHETNHDLSRYYTLIATCVLARKAEWIKNACLAAALLVPSMAAAHGIVLASLHVDGKHAMPRMLHANTFQS
jgi:hypothetical protein